MKRMIGFGFGLVGLATVGLGAGLFAQQQSTSSGECSLPKKGAFSIGWVAEDSGKHYRCLPIFDSNLKPAGAAWIEVVQEKRFIIKD